METSQSVPEDEVPEYEQIALYRYLTPRAMN